MRVGIDKIMIEERKPFSDVFNLNPDGSLSPKVVVSINGITFGPGVAFGKGVAFGGVDIFQFIGCDLSLEKRDNLYILKGYYKAG